MNIRLICILLLANTLSLHLWSQESQTKTIKTFLEKEYPENRPGAVILISKNNQIIFKEAFGLADLKKKS
jgi:hypothetical protein